MYGKSGKICGGFWRKFRRRSSSHVCTLDEHASIFPSDHCLLAIYCGIKCMPKIRHNPTQPTDVPKPCPSLIYRSIAEVTAYTSYRARQQTRVASLQSRGTTVTTHTHTHTHPFNDPLSETTRVFRYQKGKTTLDFTEATDSEWQWHQLGHMQVCTSLQTDNHASTPPLSFLQAGCPSCRPTNSVKALKARALKDDCYY